MSTSATPDKDEIVAIANGIESACGGIATHHVMAAVAMVIAAANKERTPAHIDAMLYAIGRTARQYHVQMRWGPLLRCGDVVKHRPGGEEWVVAYADYETGKLAWAGWPEGEASIAECDLVKAASDEEHARLVSAVVKSGGMRGRAAERLYCLQHPATASDNGGRQQ